VLVAVQTALQTAGGAQNGLRAFERDAAALSGDPGGAAALYEAMLSCGIGAITNRQAILGQDGFISPAGGYLPSEFYLSAMLTWFLALAVLPLAGFSSGDFSLSVLQRGMKTGAMRRHFLTARLFSGAVFLLAVMLLIFPVGLVSASLDRLFAGSVPALFGSMLFLSLCFSALALGISAWMPNRDAAMWIGFWLILALGMAGGAIVPESMLPGWVVRLGAWSPLRAAMRLLASGIFRFDAASFGIDMLKTGLWGLLGAVLAVAGFSRKAAH
jgi:ABC-type multidrug transport system permease subunit